MLGLGVPELILILVILLLLFGANRLPKISRSIGESARELKKGLDTESPKNTADVKPITPNKKNEEVKLHFKNGPSVLANLPRSFERNPTVRLFYRPCFDQYIKK